MLHIESNRRAPGVGVQCSNLSTLPFTRRYSLTFATWYLAVWNYAGLSTDVYSLHHEVHVPCTAVSHSYTSLSFARLMQCFDEMWVGKSLASARCVEFTEEKQVRWGNKISPQNDLSVVSEVYFYLSVASLTPSICTENPPSINITLNTVHTMLVLPPHPFPRLLLLFYTSSSAESRCCQFCVT